MPRLALLHLVLRSAVAELQRRGNGRDSGRPLNLKQLEPLALLLCSHVSSDFDVPR